MDAVEKASETQLKNIQTKTGKDLVELSALVHASGLKKHGEIREMLKKDLGLGHGDANALTHYVLESDGTKSAKTGGLTLKEVLDEIYSGSKSNLRPIHDLVTEIIGSFGEYGVAPKKGYVSLRRKKQFVMIGPPTNSRIEIGLNVKGLPPSPRLKIMPEGSMCNYVVKVTEISQVDEELTAWIKKAYTSAG